MTYCKRENYPLVSYAIENVSAEAEADITHLRQTKGLSAVRYSEVLYENTILLFCIR